jgi:hypothetical protein
MIPMCRLGRSISAFRLAHRNIPKLEHCAKLDIELDIER